RSGPPKIGPSSRKTKLRTPLAGEGGEAELPPRDHLRIRRPAIRVLGRDAREQRQRTRDAAQRDAVFRRDLLDGPLETQLALRDPALAGVEISSDERAPIEELRRPCHRSGIRRDGLGRQPVDSETQALDDDAM